EPAGLEDEGAGAGGGRGEPFEVHVQLAAVDGTAQASVAQRDGRVPERAGDRHGVDLDGPEVVDDRPDPAAAAVVQDVVEQGRLPGTEESGQNDHRDPPLAAPLRHALSPPLRAPVCAPAYVRRLDRRPGYERLRRARTARLSAPCAGQMPGMAPMCATLRSLRAPSSPPSRRSEPLGTLGGGTRRPPLAGPFAPTHASRRPADGGLIGGI